jgi:hypothetical protein
MVTGTAIGDYQKLSPAPAPLFAKLRRTAMIQMRKRVLMRIAGFFSHAPLNSRGAQLNAPKPIAGMANSVTVFIWGA